MIFHCVPNQVVKLIWSKQPAEDGVLELSFEGVMVDSIFQFVFEGLRVQDFALACEGQTHRVTGRGKCGLVTITACSYYPCHVPSVGCSLLVLWKKHAGGSDSDIHVSVQGVGVTIFASNMATEESTLTHV